jgi:mono/diheme cytochrome c family protein
MNRRALVLVLSISFWAVVLATVSAARVVDQNPPPAAAPRQASGGWTIPATANEEKSPLTVNPAVLANGKKLFTDKCQRCHGAEGKGDGPEGEAEHKQDMNLTVASRAARNSDGVVFYKIWNGRTTPKMPKFSEELSKEQVWAIVAYVQTLRAKATDLR